MSRAGLIRENSRSMTRRSRFGTDTLAGFDREDAPMFESKTGGHVLERGVDDHGFRVLDSGSERDSPCRGGGAGAVWALGVEAPVIHEIREDAWPLAQPRANPRGNSTRSRFRQGENASARSSSKVVVPAHSRSVVLGDGDHHRGGGRCMGRHSGGDAFVRAWVLIDNASRVASVRAHAFRGV